MPKFIMIGVNVYKNIIHHRDTEYMEYMEKEKFYDLSGDDDKS